jgi:hypothetical protein
MKVPSLSRGCEIAQLFVRHTEKFRRGHVTQMLVLRKGTHWKVFVIIILCIGHPPIGMRAPFHTTRRANRGVGRHTTRRHASEFHTSSPKTIGRFEDAPRPSLAWRRAASRTRRSLAWLGRVVVVRRRATARPVIGATVREAHGGGWSGRSHLASPPTDASAIAIAGPGFWAFIVLFLFDAIATRLTRAPP